MAVSRIFGKHPVMVAAFFAFFCVTAIFFWVGPPAADWRVDSSRSLRKPARDHGLIDALPWCAPRAVRTGADARSFFAMTSRPLVSPPIRCTIPDAARRRYPKIAESGQNRIDKRAVRIACGRMDHHSLRLIDDGERCVLIDDVDPESTAAVQARGTGSGKRYRHLITGADQGRAFCTGAPPSRTQPACTGGPPGVREDASRTLAKYESIRRPCCDSFTHRMDRPHNRSFAPFSYGFYR